MQRAYVFAESEEDVAEEELRQVGKKVVSEEDERFSKKLSQLLRHDKVGGLVREDGWAKMSEVCKRLRGGKAKEEDIVRVAEGDKKGRYGVGRGEESGARYVMARQGHSLPVQHAALEEVAPGNTPPCAIHGTTPQAWEAIQREGLSRMGRIHIHMAPALLAASGIRPSAAVLIYVDVAAALAAGIPFFISRNGVILSPGPIPPQFFAKVEFR